MFVLSLAFGWVGVGLTTAQTAPSVAAQAPAVARFTSAATSPPHVAANPPAPAQPVSPKPSGSNQATQEPQQTKVARIYRGEGYFDASLADRLRPVLAKTFAVPQVVADASPPKSAPVVLRSVLGREAPESPGTQQTR